MLELVNQTVFKELKELLNKEDVTLKVMSNSMEPLIRTDEEVVVRRLEGVPKRFDIIVYWNGKFLIGHYVWHTNKLLYSDGNRIIVTRNLRVDRDDLPVHEEQILGQIISHKLSLLWRFRLLMRNFIKI